MLTAASDTLTVTMLTWWCSADTVSTESVEFRAAAQVKVFIICSVGDINMLTVDVWGWTVCRPTDSLHCETSDTVNSVQWKWHSAACREDYSN